MAPNHHHRQAAHEADVRGEPGLLSKDVATEHLRAAVEEITKAEPGSCTVLRSTMGLGKSAQVREVVRATGEVGTTWVMVVPTHALAAQHEAELDDPSVQVRRSLGVIQGCVRRDDVGRLMTLGLDPGKTLCPTCEHKDDYQGSGNPCPAFLERTVVAQAVRVQILQNAQCHVHIMKAARSNQSKPILVLDEPPEALVTVVVDAATEQAVERVLSRLQPAQERALRPVVQSIMSAADKLATGVGRTLQEVVGEDAADITASVKSIRSLTYRSGARTEVVRGVDRRLQESLEHGKAFLEALIGAVHANPTMRILAKPDPKSWKSNQPAKAFLVAPAPWIRATRFFLGCGGKALILDGTADTALLRYFGLMFKEVVIDVEDGPKVERVHVKWADGPKKRHLVGNTVVKWASLRGVLRDVARRCSRTSSIGIIADKILAKSLQEQIGLLRSAQPATVELPWEFVERIQEARDVKITWYGNHRGLDTFMTCRTLVTLGDPFPPVDVAHAQALAVGRDPQFHQYRMLHQELVQASGRARPVHREDPVLIVHYGLHRPWPRLAPQWSDAVSLRLPAGRPEEVQIDLDEVLEVVGRVKTIDAVAAELGSSRATAYRKMKAAEHYEKLCSLSNKGALHIEIDVEGRLLKMVCDERPAGTITETERTLEPGIDRMHATMEEIVRLVTAAREAGKSVAVRAPLAVVDALQGRCDDPHVRKLADALKELGEFPQVLLHGTDLGA